MSMSREKGVKMYPAGDHWRWWCPVCGEENELEDGLEDIEERVECEHCGVKSDNLGPVA
jgi:Zn ribbon nucleic-acid-binding protein